MSEVDFWDCTPCYFMRRRRGWLDNRQGMEEARFLAYYMLKTVDTKNKIRRLTDVCRFPWEKRRRILWPEWDQEEMNKWSEAADRALAVLNPEAYAAYIAGKETAAARASVSGIGPEFLPHGELNI